MDPLASGPCPGEKLKPFSFIPFLFLWIANADFDLDLIPFEEAYSVYFGEDNGNVVRSPDGRSIRLLLDRFTGAGFLSTTTYYHGFFSAKMKLPGDYTAGVVVAFHTSNLDIFNKTHDELDFEFLGNIPGKPWRIQTNFYGNGSLQRGREERYFLWFDPSLEFHRYSMLWTSKSVVFYIDDIPIREVKRSAKLGLEYPSKPMSLYASIWDGSPWATSGGKHKVNYKYAPFVADFKDFALEGCPIDPLYESPEEICHQEDVRLEAKDFATMTSRQRRLMKKFRRQYMYYSFCHDTTRYPVPIPGCSNDPVEKRLFKNTGRIIKSDVSNQYTPKPRRRSRGGG